MQKAGSLQKMQNRNRLKRAEGHSGAEMPSDRTVLFWWRVYPNERVSWTLFDRQRTR